MAPCAGLLKFGRSGLPAALMKIKKDLSQIQRRPPRWPHKEASVRQVLSCDPRHKRVSSPTVSKSKRNRQLRRPRSPHSAAARGDDGHGSGRQRRCHVRSSFKRLVGNVGGEDFFFILVEAAGVVVHGIGPSQKKLNLNGSLQKSKGASTLSCNLTKQI